MRDYKHILITILLLIVQVLFCNYLHLSQFVVLSILPVMALFIPIRISTIRALIYAFVAGLMVDLLADGVLGLNILALVATTYARRGIIRLVFGEEVFARKEDISIARQGWLKISLALLMAETIFFVLYVWADGAGTRPMWFGVARFFASTVASFIVSIPVAELLAPDRPEKKW